MVTSLDQARENQLVAAGELEAAKKAYSQTVRQAEYHYDALHVLLRDNIGDVDTDEDGNPVSGTFGVRFNGLYVGDRIIKKNWRNGFA